MPEIQLTVIDQSGLHARPAARFVQAASRFASRIVIRNGEREADAKSLISLLGLTVKLSNVRYNVAVPESAFTFTEPKKR